MAGMTAQIGYVAETTYGTSPSLSGARFLPLISEDLALENDRIESEGIVTGSYVLESEQWAPGIDMVGGEIQHELYQQGCGVLFNNMFGSATSSATGGIATHTFTPGDLTGQGLTIQVGRPMSNGTVVPYTYAGCKVAEFEISLAAGEFAQLGLTILGQTETDGIALQAATFLTGAKRPFIFSSGSITISGSSVCVREATIAGNNNLADDRQCVGQTYIDEPLQVDLATYDGTLTIEFSSTAQYSRFKQGLEFPVVLNLTGASSARCTITMNARYDGKTPGVEGRELLVVEYPFKAIKPASGEAIQAVLVNSQTSL